MAIIYVTDKEYQADIKISLVSQEYKADLLFYEEDHDYQAKGDNLWYFTNKEYKSTIKIYWVDQEYKAAPKSSKSIRNIRLSGKRVIHGFRGWNKELYPRISWIKRTDQEPIVHELHQLTRIRRE